MDDRELIAAAFSYRANEHGFRIGFGQEFRSNLTLDDMRALTEGALRFYDRRALRIKRTGQLSGVSCTLEDLVAGLFSELDDIIKIVRRTGEMTREQVTAWVRRILWLTERGHLRNDEHNGTEYVTVTVQGL